MIKLVVMRVRRSERGVSLMEVLVGLFILSVVGAAVISGVFVAVQGNSVSRTQILAEGLTRYELEYVKSVAANNWTGITNQTDIPYTMPSAQGPLWDISHNSLPAGYEGYIIMVTISSAGVGYDANIRKVSAAVSYGGSNVITIQTYVVK